MIASWKTLVCREGTDWKTVHVDSVSAVIQFWTVRMIFSYAHASGLTSLHLECELIPFSVCHQRQVGGKVSRIQLDIDIEQVLTSPCPFLSSESEGRLRAFMFNNSRFDAFFGISRIALYYLWNVSNKCTDIFNYLFHILMRRDSLSFLGFSRQNFSV